MCALALNGWRRIAAAGIASLAAWLACAQSARAEVTVTINFDFVETRISPRQEIYRSHISVSYRISTEKGLEASTSTGLKSEKTKLGVSSTGVNEVGQTATSITQIIGGAIVMTNHQRGFFDVLKIKTDGRTSCSAQLKYFRNPGQQYFEAVAQGNGETILATDFRAENMTCSIAD